MKKDLSIIILNYKTPELVKACIASIKKYPPKVSYELIVVDNTNDNVGFAKGNNKGIKNAKGEYILLLNSDTLVKKDALDKLLDFAKSKNDAGVVGAKLLNSDGSVQESVSHFPSIWSAVKEYWFGEKGSFGQYAPQSDVPMEVESVVGAAFLITPQALKKVGQLNEKYFMYFEDLDYCRSIKKSGLKVYYVPDAKITHYLGASGKDVAKSNNQWRRLIPSSKIYHGEIVHLLINFILWSGQKIWSGQKFGKLIPIFILIILIFPAFSKLLQPGFFPMQDDLQAFRVYEMDKCFDDLQIPCRWVPDAGYQYGYPQFNFYPPLPYYVGAGLHRIGFQYIDTVKILFILGYILSAVTMFILINELKGRWSGIIAALLYTYIPYKAVEVYVRGALSEFWAQIFFPLVFWSIYKLIKTKKLIYILLMGLSISFLATTHALMTMIFAPIAIIWGMFWLWQDNWKSLWKVFFGGILGFGLSAFFILPVIFEKKFAHTESLLSGYFDYRAHFVNLYKLFFSREWGYGSSGFPNEKLNLSLGFIQWIVGLVIAPVIAIFNFRKNTKTSILILLFSFLALFTVFMIHMKSNFIWAQLPSFWYLQFPWRFLAVSIFLLCMLSGFVFYFFGKFKYILGIFLVLISVALTIPYFTPKAWLEISDKEKFSGILWEKQLTISIFDYLPIFATLPPVQKAPDFPEVLEGSVKFLDYKKGSDFQTGTIDVKENSLIRIPLYDFPGMQVKVDGKVVSHINNDCRDQKYCLGLITFFVPQGQHKIETRLKDTPVRTVGNAITLISLGILVFNLIKLKRK